MTKTFYPGKTAEKNQGETEAASGHSGRRGLSASGSGTFG